MMSKIGSIKYQEVYFQFSVQFINDDSNEPVHGSEMYLSECYRLEAGARQRYEFD